MTALVLIIKVKNLPVGTYFLYFVIFSSVWQFLGDLCYVFRSLSLKYLGTNLKSEKECQVLILFMNTIRNRCKNKKYRYAIV